MDPPDDGRHGHGSSERHEIVVDAPPGPTRLVDFIPIYIPTVEKGALSRSVRKRRFLDFLRARPSKDWFLRSTFVGRLRRRSQITSREEEEDHDDSDENYGECRLRRRGRFRVPFVRNIKWGKLWSSAARWCKRPANFAMIIWLAFVAAGLLLLFLLMTGMLDGAIPQDARRKDWTEVINQILNALFTIMCLYQHPTIFHHLVLLLRWRPDGDRDEVRKVYCKEGAPEEPHDRAHMLVVVALLHITCLAQYFCCALFWSYSRTDRPDWPLNIGYGVGATFPVIAVIYMAYSPLGRKQPDTESSSGEEAHGHNGDVEIRVYNRSVVVGSPEWSGGVLDCCDDVTVCALSATCTFCVFGWNMERLGFGNMCVHSFTFILLCIAPFLVFSATALNIHDHDIRLIVCGRGHAPVLLRVPLRRLLADADEEAVQASGGRRRRAGVGHGGRLRQVALLLELRAGAGGAHGQLLRRRGRPVRRPRRVQRGWPRRADAAATGGVGDLLPEHFVPAQD